MGWDGMGWDGMGWDEMEGLLGFCVMRVPVSKGSSSALIRGMEWGADV